VYENRIFGLHVPVWREKWKCSSQMYRFGGTSRYVSKPDMKFRFFAQNRTLMLFFQNLEIGKPRAVLEKRNCQFDKTGRCIKQGLNCYPYRLSMLRVDTCGFYSRVLV